MPFLKKSFRAAARKASLINKAKNVLKAKAKAKLNKMSKEEKDQYVKGKRNADSDSEFSYRSVVSAGGTRHVKRRRKREDGTYSAEESYHSSQDEDGEARRRRRRRDRMHGSDSEHSYFSVVSEGGTRHVRRKRRHADGTYSRSESYRSAMNYSDVSDGGLDTGEGSVTASGRRRRNGSGDTSDDDDDDDEYELESDVSVTSEVSAGGTRRLVQRKRIRDEDGNVVGYGDPKPVKTKRKGSKAGAGSEREMKAAMDSLQMKRDGQLLREKTTDSLSGLRSQADDILDQDKAWPGSDIAGTEEQILADEEAKVPSDFSDATTEDDVDLSKLTPAQRRQYFADKERRRKEREKRRREKYGDKYDEIMKKKTEKQNAELAAKHAAREAELRGDDNKLKVPGDERRMSFNRRRSSAASTRSKGGRPKSMVTYDKGPPREMSFGGKEDMREIGLAHGDWKGKKEPDSRRSRKSIDDSNDLPPKLHRETTMIKPLPTIPQGRIYEGDDETSSKTSKGGKSFKMMSEDESDIDVPSKKKKEAEEEEEKKKEEYFEVGADGKLLLKKKKIDLNNISDEELRALGIDPNQSAKEIAKQLKKMFGNIEISQGGVVIGTKGIDEYGSFLDEDELADDPDLDVDTLTGLKRVNIIMRKGGAALQRHLEKVLSLSRLVDKYAKDLDERDADIDFLSHYRLVDQSRLESYARAFVVEDSDLDTVLNSNEARVALDGVPSVQHMTNKQMDYVMRVLKIDEATMITFRMFAVVTALCERVTHMDTLSQRLLEICNLADIDRKLDLYKAMFYTNVQSDRDSNFITTESLKIELIAGGLNWQQQQHVMEKMEPNEWGDISFLDYMCYIPLFLSMHDNICLNPLDMSSDKYTKPPRTRPASVQRDMNPLGCQLTKSSAYWVRRKAMESMMAPQGSVQVSRSYMDILNRYTSEKYTKLQKIEDIRNIKKENTDSSLTSKSSDMIY